MSEADRLRELMAAEGAAVHENTQAFNANRYASIADLEDYEALKTNARAIKKNAIEQLPELVEDLRETVKANGGHVYLADDGADATRYVRRVVADREASRVVKSKSMTTEEINLNDALEADGVEVVETDLGEWVLQVAEEAPSHIVAPAIHKSRAEIAALLNAVFEPEPPLESAPELTRFAREHLGNLVRGAEVGITGANFVTADTGTIALVTSEGNARKTVAATDTHIAVAGVEKVVPSVEDLQPFVELIGRSGTGQDITAYVSLLTPPVATPVVDFGDDETPLSECESDREFHLVLIDNGRMAMREDEVLQETLYCIRCSACANSCANFQQVGGHAFGGETYSGGIATGWEAGVEGLNVAAEFNDLCTGCSRCVNACPVGIDIPWINTAVRDRINRQGENPYDFLVDGLVPDMEAGSPPLSKRFFGNFGTVARLASATAPVSNWLASARPSRALMKRVLGVEPRRELPKFRRETLVEWFRARESPVIEAPTRRAVLYPDLYTNHVLVDRGKAAVRTLEALGVDVVVPSVGESGRAPLSQGMVATAKTHAERVADALVPHIEVGRDVVMIEPSDHAMVQREYGKLLDADTHERLAEHSFEVLEYVFGLLDNGTDPAVLRAGEGERVAYHSHCQQRTLGLDAHTVAVLKCRGFDVLASDVECCGMAGSFGYKTDYYDVSMAVGEDLREQFTETEAEGRVVLASGTSCQEQIDSLLKRDAYHPIEVLSPTG